MKVNFDLEGILRKKARPLIIEADSVDFMFASWELLVSKLRKESLRNSLENLEKLKLYVLARCFPIQPEREFKRDKRLLSVVKFRLLNEIYVRGAEKMKDL